MTFENLKLNIPFNSIHEERMRRIKSRYIDDKRDIKEFKLFLNNLSDENVKRDGLYYLNKVLETPYSNINVNIFSYQAHLVRVAMLTVFKLFQGFDGLRGPGEPKNVSRRAPPGSPQGVPKNCFFGEITIPLAPRIGNQGGVEGG